MVTERFFCFGCFWDILCYCPFNKTFTITIFVLLFQISLKERFSLVVGLWYMIFSISMMVYYYNEELIPILILGTLISVALKCKLDECMQSSIQFNNSVLKLLTLSAQLLEQITYLLILLITTPFSFVESLCYCIYSSSIGGDSQCYESDSDSDDVTVDQFVDDVNTFRNGYCFLHVLESCDRHSFISKLFVLFPDQVKEIYRKKTIKLSCWLKIMKKLKLSKNYVVYRRAYWGENTGKREISDKLTNYLVPLWYLERYKSKNNQSTISSLIDLFHSFNINESKVSILLENNHMVKVEFGLNFKISSWYNTEYKVKNDQFAGSNL